VDTQKLKFAVISLAAAAWALNGCAGKPVATPPVFNLYGYQRLAVVPFNNASPDPALAKTVQNEMTDQVVGLAAVPVIDAAQVAAYLKGLQANPAAVLTDEGLRKKLGQKFQCDILLMGSADAYNEFLKDEAPKRLPDPQTNEPKWGFFTDRKVVVNASAKLVDVASGSLLWTEKNQGYSWYNTWNPLPIPGSVTVPDQLGQFLDLAHLLKNRINHETDDEPATLDENAGGALIYPKSRAFADLREKAVSATVKGIVADFRGHGDWTPAK
jgi:hypothetical protein